MNPPASIEEARAQRKASIRASRTRKRTREALEQYAAPVAFARDAEARHALTDNANRGKRRHPVTGTRTVKPRETFRQYAPGMSKERRMRHVEITHAGIPSLPGQLVKRVPRP